MVLVQQSICCVCIRADNGSVGQWVMGQMGRRIWVGHMGHGSVPVTHRSMNDDDVSQERFQSLSVLDL